MNSLDSQWKATAREQAIAKVSHQLDISRVGVKAVVQLAKQYFHETIVGFSLDEDLMGKPTRFAIPFYGGYYQLPRVLVIHNYYIHGHITEKQYNSYMNDDRKEQLQKIKHKHEQYKRRLATGEAPWSSKD